VNGAAVNDPLINTIKGYEGLLYIENSS